MNMQDDAMHMEDNRIDPRKDVTLEQGNFPDTSISSFLSRPILIHKHVWDPTATGGIFSERIKPWNLVLTNPAIAEKLSRFKLLRADLMIKIIINGSPFHYGRMMASYSPMSVAQHIVINGGPSTTIARSQLPRIFVDPTYSKGGCICVPYYWPNPWFDLSQDDFEAYGTLNMDAINPLKVLGTQKSVTITIIAWLENVKLSGSTFVAQSTGSSDPVSLGDIGGTDEYADKNGVISGPATTVAAISGALENAPVIGPFAKATTIAANAVSSIARMFGFSRPPNVEPLTLMRNTPYSNLAAGTGMDSVQKLTLDPKNELTISSEAVGLDEGDNLSFDFLLRQRDTYVGTFSWNDAQPYGTKIHTMAVNPCMWGNAASWVVNTSDRGFQPTTLHGVSRLFNSWSGTIKFRIQIVAAHSHRGRLVVLYDPSGSTGVSAANIDTYSVTNYNQVIDLADCRDYEFEVHWSQAVAYKRIRDDDLSGAVPDFATSITYADAYNNGTITFAVVNELSALDSPTDVSINVFISAGEHFELQNFRPHNYDLNLLLPPYSAESVSLPYVAESAENVDSDDAAPDVSSIYLMPSGPRSSFEHKPLVYFGERYESLRPLFKRYGLYQMYKPFNNTSTYTVWRNWMLQFSRYQYPAYSGYSTTGYHTTATGEKFNYTRELVFMYITSFFAGRRGSVRYKASVNGPGASGLLQVNRYVNPTLGGTTSIFDVGGVNSGQATKQFTQNFGNVMTGAVVTSQGTMQSLEYEVPFMSDHRFYPTRVMTPIVFDENTATPLDAVENQYQVRFVSEDVDGENSMINLYCAAGEDYSLSFFVGCPPIYSYTQRWPAAEPP